MSDRDKIILLGEFDAMLANVDPAYAPDPYFRQHGERWRSAVNTDRVRIMRDLHDRGLLPEPWESEIAAVLRLLQTA